MSAMQQFEQYKESAIQVLNTMSEFTLATETKLVATEAKLATSEAEVIATRNKLQLVEKELADLKYRYETLHNMILFGKQDN